MRRSIGCFFSYRQQPAREAAEGVRWAGVIAALKACGATGEVEAGRSIHRGAEQRGGWSIYAHNAVIEMYAKCGHTRDASAAFWRIPCHDQASWNSLILGYAATADAAAARHLLDCMASSGCPPTAPTFLAALRACVATAATKSKLDALDWGMSLHSQAGQLVENDLFVGSALIDMYAKCGSLLDARAVFDRMALHDLVSWTCLILGFAENGQGDMGLELFASMTSQGGCQPSSRTFVAALVACAASADKEVGRLMDGQLVKVASLDKCCALHAGAVEIGAESDTFVANTVIDVFSRCGSLVNARNVFDRMVRRDVVSWNVMISGYADNGHGDAALDLFARIGCAPTSRTFVAALTACCSVAEHSSRDEGLSKGRAVHAQARSSGYEFDVYVASTLVFMYAKCGCLVEACRVFQRMPSHDVVASTALMLGYTDNGECGLALELYQRMQGHGAETYVAALKACAALADKEEWQREVGSGRLVKAQSLETGARIHSQAAESGCESDVFVSNTLIDMYCKCGSVADARAVFDAMKQGRSLVSWNALLLGYVENGEDEVALETLSRMSLSCAPDARSYVAGLMACGNLVALDAGRQIHALICREELDRGNAFVVHRLVDFYGKCGRLLDAQLVFDASGVETTRDVLIWSALIGGYSCQGGTAQAFRFFEDMKNEAVQPNAVTFISLLNACNHGGLVDDGERLFATMHAQYGIQPEIRHYHCMVDMLGRANRLDDAVTMVASMPFEATLVTWTTVLGACRKWNNMPLGKLAFEASLRLDDSDAATYTLMANIYGSLGMWQEQFEVLVAMRRRTSAAALGV
ncbi:pentatricopeptide repeat-containing protein At4g33170-like [Selaginella moellendorffii]|uniref:pentatricopeptide repeat-containing protein At4g33170-like n=1 Tax=Selaginella moellendorffii TaxID=88036 RepID=UPI000D1CBA6C|nr:pentatricopeptide repeat-containing protein At4g33170-like [Selaginella moellendorffii]|eukprot:XP_024545864.1 pentatricopeptide repeat-containing protein At4g33170-like [Selaginella moellendorffii]